MSQDTEAFLYKKLVHDNDGSGDERKICNIIRQFYTLYKKAEIEGTIDQELLKEIDEMVNCIQFVYKKDQIKSKCVMENEEYIKIIMDRLKNAIEQAKCEAILCREELQKLRISRVHQQECANLIEIIKKYPSISEAQKILNDYENEENQILRKSNELIDQLDKEKNKLYTLIVLLKSLRT